MRLLSKQYNNLNIVYINKNHLIHNFNYFDSLYKGISIAPVIKSNAYSHGIKNVAKILDPLSPPFFIVDSLYEAYILKKEKIKTPILILGYTNHENLKFKKLNFQFAIYDIQTLHILNKYQKGVKVHIFIDTGMKREGILIEDLPYFIKEMKKCKNLYYEGLMSHLADADNKTSLYNKKQIEDFKKGELLLNNAGFNFKWKHISATYGALNIKDNNFNLLRVGLGMYIAPTLKLSKKVKNVLSLKSHVIQIKNLKKGEMVGYNITYTAKKNIQIALIPLGYYEGVIRSLSNCGVFTIKGVKCPIIGRISMNLTTIDISRTKNVKVGDEVLVYSDNYKDCNSINNVSNIIKEIPYTVLTHINSNIKRESI